MRKWDRYNEEYGFYTFSKTIKWDYEQVHPYKGDVLKDDRRMYLHLYYNPEKALEDESSSARLSREGFWSHTAKDCISLENPPAHSSHSSGRPLRRRGAQW